jgi:signal transduction histidine kinase/ligand-binding sensor domain-containing protein
VAPALIALILLLVPGTSVAGNDFLIETWLTDQGLPQNSVIAITQTPEGYLWLTTRNAGLARYDGARFTSFSPLNTPALQSFEMLHLSVADDGALIVTDIDGNITRLQGGEFTRVPQPAVADAQWFRAFMPTPNNTLVGIAFSGASNRPLWPGTGGPWEVDQQGVIWFRTRERALARFADGRAETVSPDAGLHGHRVQCVAMDARGTIWVGTDQGIAAWDGKRFADMTPTNGPAELSVHGMAFSSDGALWLDNGKRLLKCRDRQWLAESPPWDEEFNREPYLRWLHGDADGGAWLLHFSGGVFHANREGQGGSIHFPDGTPVRQANCWYQDREHNVWLGLENGGLLRLRSRIFSLAAIEEGRDYQAKSICEDQFGRQWAGTAEGVVLGWMEDRVTVIPTPYRGEVVVHPRREGGLWVGTVADGVFTLEDGTLALAPGLTLPFPAVRALLEDRTGRLWIGGEKGLFHMHSRELVKVEGPDASSAYVLALAEGPDGAIWFGTATAQLGRIKDGSVEIFTPENRNTLCRFWALLAEPDGTVWVGTLGGGLLRFREDHFVQFTRADGLPDDTICQILDDGRGWLWLGTRSGISRVEKRSLDARAHGQMEKLHCLSYGREDGLPTLECSAGMQPASWIDRQGRLWFTTTKGVVSVSPATVPFNPLPPMMAIEEVLVDGRVQVIAQAGPAASSGGTSARMPRLTIAPGKHHIEIHYAGLSFAAVEKVRFRHRLEGLDAQWVDAGRRRTATFDHLPAGNYIFRVQASNNDGVWNETGATLALSVQPHVWQTAWFRVALGALVLGMVVTGVRLRERRRTQRKLQELERQHTVERERARIARDIHDELGASLTCITALSDSTREELDDRCRAAANLDRIHSTASALTHSMSEIVWAVNPQHDRLDSLSSYVEAFAQQCLADAGIRCRFEIPTQIPAISLGAQTRHTVFLAFKEALNNVIKHSGASEARIFLQLRPDAFVLGIEDNGCGLPPAGGEARAGGASRGGGSGYGLPNMRARLEEIGGRCEVTSESGGGIRVEFHVPTGPAAFEGALSCKPATSQSQSTLVESIS